MVHPISRHTIWAFFRLFIHKVKGLENIPKKGAFVLAANHESELDPLILYALIMPKINKKLHFLAVERLFRSRLRMIVWRRWVGAIPVDENAIPESLELLKRDEVVGIFPEGEKTSAELIKPKTGVARIALESNAPIIPVGIINTSRILPMNERIPKRLGRIVRINIGKPIKLGKHNKKYNKRMLRKITDDIMSRIAFLAKTKYC